MLRRLCSLPSESSRLVEQSPAACHLNSLHMCVHHESHFIPRHLARAHIILIPSIHSREWLTNVTYLSRLSLHLLTPIIPRTQLLTIANPISSSDRFDNRRSPYLHLLLS